MRDKKRVKPSGKNRPAIFARDEILGGRDRNDGRATARSGLDPSSEEVEGADSVVKYVRRSP